VNPCSRRPPGRHRNFVDQQLSIPPEQALLEARILNIRPPYANFYRAALGAVDKATRPQRRPRLCTARRAGQREFIDAMRQKD